MKKISMILVLVLLCTSMSFAATVPSDVTGNVYEEAIVKLAEKGIITGDVDGKFYPDSRLTRAQACIMVVKAMNPPAAEISGTPTQMIRSGFSDMTGYGWAEGYIAYAVKKGVVKGYPDGTFKPGSNVTIEEITTMVLRAAGHSDQSLGGTYPSNYMDKGNTAGLFEDMVTILIYPMQVTKAMTAKILFNGLTMIEAANPPAEDHSGETPSSVPTLAGKTFATGSFNSTMTEFNGMKIASNVVVYTYGEKLDYKSSMTLSKNPGDFRLDTVYKYKNVTTPLWYAMKDGQITSILLPMDVGYTGYAYGVINATVMTLNAEGEAVKGFKTLVAGQPILWMGTTSLITDYPETESALYEFNLRDGQIRSIAMASDPSAREAFVEVAAGVVYFYEEGLVRLTDADGLLFEVKENAAVYVLSEDGEEFTAGRLSDLDAGERILAYDMTDDDNTAADVILVGVEDRK